MDRVRKWVWRRRWAAAIVGTATAIALVASMVGVGLDVRLGDDAGDIRQVGFGQVTLTIGHVAYGAGTADYTCDGAADDVQVQQAVNALPATGGKIIVLAGTYNFTATVTRAIDNVQLEGVGRGTNFVYDGATPIFTAGGDNWIFANFRTDAGGVNTGATTGWEKRHILEGANFTAYQSQLGVSLFNDVTVASLTDSGLTSGRIPIVGVAGLLGDDAGLTWSGGNRLTATNITTGSLTDSGLTSGRIPIAGVGGLLGDDADLTWAGGNTLTATQLNVNARQLRDTGTKLQIDGYSIVRSATVTVAADDSSAVAKVQADYVCDGTNDEIELQAANTAAAAVGGSVFCHAGTYTITTTDLTLTALMQGEPSASDYNETAVGTVFSLASARHIILNYPGDIRYVNVIRAGGSDYIVKMEVVSGLGNYSGCSGPLLDGLNIYESGGANGSTGLWLHANATDANKHISLSTFGSITIYACEIGLHLEAEETGSFDGYINGNNFLSTIIDDCTIGIQLEAGAGSTGVGGNVFLSTQFQYITGTTNGIKIIGACLRNRFPNIITWDWDSGQEEVTVSDTSGNYNYFAGTYKYFSDADPFHTNIHRSQHIPRQSIMLYPKDGWATSTNGTAVETTRELDTNDVNISYFAFAHDSTESAEWWVIAPYDLTVAVSTTMTATFYWTKAAGGLGGVRWEIHVRGHTDSGAMDIVYEDTGAVTDAAITTNDLHISPATPALSWTITSLYGLHFKVKRVHDHADDDLEQDAQLMGVRVDFY